ncbi:MAG: hypothetical protein WCC08_20950, partial [Terrimicrobiaceae bacterium]
CIPNARVGTVNKFQGPAGSGRDLLDDYLIAGGEFRSLQHLARDLPVPAMLLDRKVLPICARIVFP